MPALKFTRGPMRNKRGLVYAAGAVTVAIAAIGAAHAPFARPLLMRLGGCPMAGARMTTVEAENARHLAVSFDRGESPAPARPALGFELDSTTLAEVRDWAHRERVDCDDPRPGLLKCTAVRPGALGLPDADGKIDELALEFNGQGRLVNATTFRTRLNAGAAASEAGAIVASLAEKLGPAQQHAGDFGVSHFAAAGAKSISTVTYRYRDYLADVTAMNAPSGGPSIREQYISAKD
jgi:hypothetical protein